MTKLFALTIAALLWSCPGARTPATGRASRRRHATRIRSAMRASWRRTLTQDQPSIVMPRVVDFEPGRVRVHNRRAASDPGDRRRPGSLRGDRAVITATAYGASTQGDDADLGQRRAEKIRSYFIRYGVPAEDVVAVGHADEPGTPATVGLTSSCASERARARARRNRRCTIDAEHGDGNRATRRDRLHRPHRPRTRLAPRAAQRIAQLAIQDSRSRLSTQSAAHHAFCTPLA